MWNTSGRIANILLRQTPLRFYSPTYLLTELSNHQEKLARKLRLDYQQLLELQHIVTRKIDFVEEKRIATRNWIAAEKLTSGIDMDDIAFVALSLELECPIWTGDKKLLNLLSGIQVYSTSQLEEHLNG